MKKSSPTYGQFQIIRHRSNRDVAVLPDGVTEVHKVDKFWIAEYGGFIPATRYDDGHFIYEIPERLAQRFPGSIYRCTCGSPGIVTGNSGYLYGQSAQGLMFVCQAHSTNGKHVTGGDRWI